MGDNELRNVYMPPFKAEKIKYMVDEFKIRRNLMLDLLNDVNNQPMVKRAIRGTGWMVRVYSKGVPCPT